MRLENNMKDAWLMTWKEKTVSCLKVLAWHWSGENEKDKYVIRISGSQA
jgi:hypothetical protein